MLMADSPENEAQMAAASVDAQTGPGKPSTVLWLGLLGVYLALFASTGYLAFLNKHQLPGYEKYEQIASIEDQETKAFVIEALKQEDAEHGKRQDLATQSFNVVLGALLGFMSASATSLIRRRDYT